MSPKNVIKKRHKIGFFPPIKISGYVSAWNIYTSATLQDAEKSISWCSDNASDHKISSTVLIYCYFCFGWMKKLQLFVIIFKCYVFHIVSMFQHMQIRWFTSKFLCKFILSNQIISVGVRSAATMPVIKNIGVSINFEDVVYPEQEMILKENPVLVSCIFYNFNKLYNWVFISTF